jgi:hypothetical protein
MNPLSAPRQSVRALGREPGFTALALLTVALGLGTATAVYSLVHAVLLRPYPYRDPQGLVRLESRHTKRGGVLQGSSLLDVEDYRRRATTLEDIGAYFAVETQILGDGPSEIATITQFNPAALNILGVQRAPGPLLQPEADIAGGNVHSALISCSLWQNRFAADPNVLRRPLRTDRVSYTIVGIMPPGFGFPQQTSIWTPMEAGMRCSHPNVHSSAATRGPTPRLLASGQASRSRRQRPT